MFRGGELHVLGNFFPCFGVEARNQMSLVWETGTVVANRLAAIFALLTLEAHAEIRYRIDSRNDVDVREPICENSASTD